MKIAFIKPPIGGILGLEMLTFVEPLGPICVAACLEADGHECRVYDLRVVGGHDASRDPEFFKQSGIDAVAAGDGEEVMPPLVNALRDGTDLRKIRGVETYKNGEWFFSGAADARPNLDTYPLPARHLIKHYADHYYINFRKPLALMETARGCPFKCNFCSVWKFHESTFREKSPERVVEELKEIAAPNIFVTDDIFWMNVKRG